MSRSSAPQFLSLLPGSFLLVTAGMHMASSLMWQISKFQYTLHMQCSWFIGVIIGIVLMTPLILAFRKLYFILISAAFVLIGGVLLTALPENAHAITAARYLNGIGIGFITLPFLVHATEISANCKRGALLSMEQLSISIGIAIQMIYTNYWPWNYSMAPNCLLGIINLACAALSIVAILWFVESPVFHLRHDDEQAALESERRLYKPKIISEQTHMHIGELKQYVAEQSNETMARSFVNCLVPGFKVVLHRTFVAMNFSLPLMWVLFVSTLISMGINTEARSFPPAVFPIIRLAGALVAFFLMDRLGRKYLSICSLILTAAMFMGIAIIFENSFNILRQSKMWITVVLILVSQFSAGIYDSSSSIYLGEAFSLRLKAPFMAFVILLQNIVYIVTICTFDINHVYTYHLAVCILMLAFAFIFIVILPETKNTSLEEANQRFRRFLTLETCTNVNLF